VNLTPMIDVVMVLIVFFLIVGNLASARYARVDLPDARRAGLIETTDPLVINAVVGSGERVFLVDGVELDESALETLVRAARRDRPDRPVRIRADRSLTYGEVRPAIEACRRAGVARVWLATQGG